MSEIFDVAFISPIVVPTMESVCTKDGATIAVGHLILVVHPLKNAFFTLLSRLFSGAGHACTFLKEVLTCSL